MINQQLLDFIKLQLSKGLPKEKITQDLLNNGWNASDVEEGFNALTPRPSVVPPVFTPPVTPVISPISNPQPTQNFINPTISPSMQPISSFTNSAIDQQAFIEKWSWGGFLLAFFYFLGSRNYLRAFLYFLGWCVPILNIFLWIKGGLRGRKLVWESGKWTDFPSYQKRQKLLDRIGVWWFFISIFLSIILAIIIIFSLNSAMNKGKQEQLVSQQQQQAVQQELNQQQVNQTTPTNSASVPPNCGSDANCFIQAAQNCTIANDLITVKQPVGIDLVTLTEQPSISGIKSGNCLFKMSQNNAVVELNPDAIQAMKTAYESYVASGKMTQQQYDNGFSDSGLKKQQDTDQSFWNTQIGVTYDCSIPSNVLVPILKKLLIPQPAPSDYSVSGTFGITDGFAKYCTVSAPNFKK